MISVIVCSAEERKFVAVAEMYGRQFGAVAHEVIRIPDARSEAEGYNRAIARSRGDVLLLSHDDVEVIAPDLPGRLAAHLAAFDLIGIACHAIVKVDTASIDSQAFLHGHTCRIQSAAE